MSHFDEPDDESKRKLDHFDWTRMRYPSDKMSIASLRGSQNAESSYTTSSKLFETESFQTLEVVIRMERELAQIAYCQAAGIPEKFSGVTFSERDWVERLLTEEYSNLKITAGEMESKQWIRSIESQSRQQAGRFGSREQ